MLTSRFCFTALSLLLTLSSAQADPVVPAVITPVGGKVEQGWFFYDDPVKQAEVEQALIKAVTPSADLPPDDKPKPAPCKQAATWTAACGFVDPGQDFAWQSQERDALLQHMILAPTDQVAVEAFQHYNKWVVDKALLASKTWNWNVIQHPELDPRVATPINATGLLIAVNLTNSRAPDIYRFIAQNGGMLFFFTRDDCSYCHDMAQAVHGFVMSSGIPTYDASIKGACVAGFDKEHCLPAAESYGPATVLQISVVPALVLYMPKDTWIKLATGMTTTQKVEDRLLNFFIAWRSAVSHGIAGQNSTAPVDFDPAHTPNLGSGLAAGVGPATLPTESDIKSILFGK